MSKQHRLLVDDEKVARELKGLGFAEAAKELGFGGRRMPSRWTLIQNEMGSERDSTF